MKTKTNLLNLLVVVSMILMAISPAVASAAPAVPAAQPSAVANSGPVVSQPVSPAKTDGLPPAPTVKAVPESKGFTPNRSYSRLLPKASNPAKPAGDAALQTRPGAVNMPAPIVNFEALNNISGYYPPDTNGEVGPNHYVQMVNVSTAVYDKSGNLLYGPFFPSALWPTGDVCAGADDGDPVVIYDQLADRWLLSQFKLPNYPNGPFYECIAVSKTGVPTNVPSDWYPYTFLVSSNKMNDYPKLSVWPDGYYMTSNEFGPSSAGCDPSTEWCGVGVWAFDRAKMLNGQAATFQYVDLSTISSNYGGMLPVDLDGSNLPPAGSPAFFAEVDDNVLTPALGADAVRLWKFHVDWTTPANSTFGLSGQPNAVLPVTSFDMLPCTISGSRNCIPQQSSTQKLDSLGDRLMFRATYRNFGDHESVLLNHTVLADGADRAGVRWYEVRNLGTTPTIYQQGTYAPADGQYRWMGSIAMDHVGNIGLGYSVSSSTLDPSIRYAGRLSTDPAGTLPQAEANIITGSGAQTGTGARWGDYSDLTVDPVDDCTFWYTTEYIQTTGGAPWQTRVASFKFPNCALGPQGTLAGVITNTATSAPIVGAAVQATASITQSGATSTSAGGNYSMLLLTGSYTVTASAFGFLPQTYSNVAISQNATTTLNIGLTPAPTYVVSGTIRDALAGWPLYAKIVIPGVPGDPIWTDPATGFYSVTLPGGITYLFNVSAYSAGYNADSQSVGPLAGNTTVNIGLNADAAACTAPGYALSVAGVQEKFDSVTVPALPSGWATTVVTSTSTAPIWATNIGTRYPSGFPAYSPPNLAYFNSFSAGAGAGSRLYSTSTISMASLPAGTDLSFWMYHDTGYPSANDRVQVQISTDGGATWQDVGAPISRYTGTTGWEQQVIPLTAYATATIQIGFLGISEYGNDVHIDNVLIGTESCLPNAGGLVVGNVNDVNTSLALGGVKVSSLNDSVSTNANGFYTLFSPAGSMPITASLQNYKTEVATVTVPLSGTVRQNFALGAGKLAANPTAIAVSISAGMSTTVPLTLTNSGSLAASYSLIELDKGGVPYGPFGIPLDIDEKVERDLEKDALDLSLPAQPQYPPYAAGTVIQSWTPTGVTGPWGVAYDTDDNSVWISSPSASWGGTSQIFEFAPNGTPSGRSYAYTWNPTNGPADGVYNKNTGTLWVMNINTGVANCIYEIDPATGPTGNKICPTGSTGFSTSQRGVAYDPSTDTYFAGGWNDEMVYRFKPDGTLLNSKNVGIAVAGLAYNPTTQHLFVVDSAAASKFYVLDAANDYAPLGSFSASGFTGGAGLEIDCNGNLWAADQGTGNIFEIESGETADFCSSDVPWLSTAPVTGTLAAATAQVVNVKLDGDAVQPGVYNAQLKIKNDTPYDVPNVPVKMTVTAQPTWGKLTGNVSTQGYCDATPAALSRVTVTVQSAAASWDLVTDDTGQYNYWLDQAYSPLTITVNLPDYEFSQITGVNVVGQGTTTNDFTLRWLQPCMTVNPPAIATTLSLGQSTTRPFRLTNAGAASTAYSMTEQYVSAPALPQYHPTVIGAVPAAINGKSFGANPNPPTAQTNQAPILLAPTTISLTESLSQQIMAGNSVSCNASGIHDDNHYIRVFDLPTFGISGGLNVTAVQVGIETAVAGTGSTQPAEVRLYTLSGPLLFANMTPIGTAAVQVSNQSQTILNVPIAATVPAGSKLVVDFFTPSGAASGHSLFVGSNNLGQTAPTYIAASVCGISEPTDVSTIGFPGMNLVMNVVAEGSAGGIDVAWLSQIPVTGTVAADSFLNTTIGFDANAVAVPGTYKANVNVNTHDPKNPTRTANMTLNVTAPANWGVVTGTVNSLGYCDVNSAPLSGATVVLQAPNGLTRTVTTNANGSYTLWLNSLTNPYTLTVTAPDHIGSSPVGGLTVDQLGAVTVAPTVNLRSIQPCVSYAPPSIEVTVPWAGAVTQTLTLSNTGMASSLFTVTERSAGFIPMKPIAPDVSGGPDAFGYTFKDSNTFGGPAYAWIDATDGTTITLPDDDAEANITLPFAFQYYTTTATALRVGKNGGTLYNATTGDVSYSNSAMSSAPNNFLALMWDDQGAAGNVYWKIVGSAPNREAVIEWYNVDRYAYPTGIGAATYEMILHENGNILFQYQDVDYGDPLYNGGASATVGIRGLDSANSLQYSYNTAALTNSLSVCFAYPGLAADCSGATADVVDWVAENPTTGNLAADNGVQDVSVVFNSNAPDITQPGTYYASLNVATEDAVLSNFAVPITMTVVPAATQGKLNGTVTSLGYCDTNPAPLDDVSLVVQNALGVTHTLTTDASGYFQEWLNQGPYTVTVAPANYMPGMATGIITGGVTTTLNLNLRWLKPCVSVTPASLSAELRMGLSTTLPFTVSNTGAASTTFSLSSDVLVVNDGGSNDTAVSAFTTALTNLGYTYDVVSSSSTTGIPATLLNYKYVIYAGVASTGAESNQLTTYLDNGGSLLIADNDFGYDMRGTPLYATYLEAAYDSDSGSDGVITGTNIMAGVVTDISSDPYPDSFTITGTDAFGIFLNKTPGTWAGSAIARNTYHAIYLAWDYYYAGGSAVGDPVETTILQKALAWLPPVPAARWLTTSPSGGTLVADTGAQSIGATLDAGSSLITQPGVYTDTIAVKSNDPVNPTVNVPVTLTVDPLPTMGLLMGTVNGLAACDVNPAPLANAAVLVESATMSWTLTTNAGGVYQVWADADQAPLTATVSKAGFVGQSVAGVPLTATQTTTRNFDLRLLAPCASSAPSNLSTTLTPNHQQTQTLTISNTGTTSLTWNIKEEPALLAPIVPQTGDAALPVIGTFGGAASDVVGNVPEAVKELQPSALGLISKSHTPANVLFDNGPLTTNPGSGAGGADASALQTALGMDSYGSGHAVSTGYRVADDFVVSGGDWQIDAITFFAYQTGSGTTSTIDHVNLRIWDGVPGASGSNIVWGDTTTNRLSNTTWSNIYRVLDTDLTNADRPIMADTVDVGISLPPGTYWLDWQTGGTGSSGPWAPPISILGQTTTGNARQYDGSAWAALTDGGTLTPQGLPFVIEGSSGCATDVPWISTSPISGTTAPDSSSNVDVVFDSTGLSSGIYTGNLCVNTNDATHSKVLVPVSLTVPTPTLTLHTAGNGMAVADPAGTYDYGDVITLTASPDTGWSFASWSGDMTGSDNPITFTLEGDTVVTATFAINTFTLTPTSGANGSITPNTPQTVNYGGSQTFAIAADTGYHISDVGVDGASIGVVSAYTFTNVMANHTITATFAPDPVNLTVNVVGNGTVTKNPDQAYYWGDVITLTANADLNWAFSGWSGDLSGTTNPTAITLTGDKVVTATFVSTCVPVSGVDFSYAPMAPKVSKIVTFNGTALTGTAPITYSWNFGDGSAVGSGTPITHLFPITLTTQSYTVMLTAANACGTAPVLKSLAVQPQTVYLPLVRK